ncbi:ABC transporter permease [Dyella flava]|uniref:ABC transporter permease n=1 Tax=Dyella flava TaxID=1920170 RepID=A0ABS2K230_9GAMM|nr:FtsX-like permease family protein [Dyella flava]MBM7125206.1 ABC transporter permease [Dyella flava]GLQ52079.1 ABC transporter permease [Dyella flava]
MPMHPILSALRRHKTGTVLIALQIALTLAIVCNALLIIKTQFEQMGRPTGLDEHNLFVVATTQSGIDSSTDDGKSTLDASIKADLAALRQLPDVVDAYETRSLPLTGGLWGLGIRLMPNGAYVSHTTYFQADEHTLATLGLRLVAGRNFRSDEIGEDDDSGVLQPAVIIVSKHLADNLFPRGEALGKSVYFTSATKPSTIVGIVERMQTSSTYGGTDNRTWDTTLMPMRLVGVSRYYVVRVRSGRLDAAMQSVPEALYVQDPQRIIPDGSDDNDPGVRSFAQIRSEAYQGDRTLAMLMGIISIILLAVTGCGIAGLSSFWVGQRRRHIGVRRALGATRRDIARYFLIENALISAIGIIVGILFAFEFNGWLMKQFELARLPPTYVLIGAAMLLMLSQGAALAPALRAARIAPVQAIRSR